MTARKVFALLLVSCSVALAAQSPQPAAAKPAPTLRSTLLAQLRSTHNTAEWFTPINAAVAGLTAEQAKWVPLNAAGKPDPNANHSAGMLAYHLNFWNLRALQQLRGEKPPAAPSNNDETFNDFDAATWSRIVTELDTTLTAMEDIVAKASDEALLKMANLIQHTSAHNAYHTGQILYVRKLQGSWNPANGVK